MNTNRKTLEDAAQKAISESFDEMECIRKEVGILIDLLKDSRGQLENTSRHSENSYSHTISNILSEYENEIRRLINKQYEVFKTFNIVFFGRTGAGKSSLISAMTRANGELVSHGESDWTTDVAPREWHKCQIYDTPGINGWGRTQSRKDLEEKARQAVEVADFVLVCFDSQSQQADEFAKLSAWVKFYQKPIIAILNCRNHLWRMPTRVNAKSDRESLSRSVRQHAINIRDELAKIGLFDVPIIAINSKRAHFARATLPFEGPDAISFNKLRKQFGADMLETWSAYYRLEELLTQTILDHSVELRIGALNNQLSGILRGIHDALSEQVEIVKQQAISIENTLIAPRFTLLGYPAQYDEHRRNWFRKNDRNLLNELEGKRDGAFQADQEGDFRRFIIHTLNSKLRILKLRALEGSEDLIIQAFEKGENLNSKDIKEKSINSLELKKEAKETVEQGIVFLKKSIDLTSRDFQIDVEILSQNFNNVDGSSGDGWKYSSWATKVAGAVAAVATGAVAAVVITNIWNPVGWAVALAAGGTSALVGTAFTIMGEKLREKAEKERLSARSKAIADTRKIIHEVYDQLENDVISKTDEFISNNIDQLILDTIQNALEFRVIESSLNALCSRTSELSNPLKPLQDPQPILWNKARSLELKAYPDDPNAMAKYWLGEDWITDTTGLESITEDVSKNKATKHYDPSIFELIFSQISNIFSWTSDGIEYETAQRWLVKALEKCSAFPDALTQLAPLMAITQPKIYLVGDYNAGKSSFIKRLLIDAGLPIPDTLETRANPTTEVPHEYDWLGFTLVDCPGFQSSNKTHSQKAMEALPDASLVIFLFQPNLVLGDDKNMKLILQGSKDIGLVPKKNRIFFIINRSDELGIDPEIEPESYKTLVERKKNELCLALGSRNISVTKNSIFCMASDPYGLVGNRQDVNSTAYDRFRLWDGLSYFRKAFSQNKVNLLRSGVAHSILEGGLSRLTELINYYQTDINTLEARAKALERIKLQIIEVIRKGEILAANQEDALTNALREQGFKLIEEILCEHDSKRLEILGQNLSEWWKQDICKQEIERWLNTTCNLLNDWHRKSLEEIGRRFNSQEIKAAFGTYSKEAPNLKFNNKGNFLKNTLRESSNFLNSVTRDIVYGAGKTFGVKFRPWGAVKLTKTLGKVGVALGVVAVIVEIALIPLEENRMKKIDNYRLDLRKYVNEVIPKVVNAVAYNSDVEPDNLQNITEPGLLQIFNCKISDFLHDIGIYDIEIREIRSSINHALEIVDIYQKLCDEAILILGNPWEN